MGFDLSGVNPTINYEHPKEWYDIMKKWGNKSGYLEGAYSEIPQDVKDKYFELQDLYNHKNVGNYFRNNVWWWRPLWEFVSTQCKDFLSDKDIKRGEFNDGHLITEDKALLIGHRLKDLIEDGTVDFYEKESTLIVEQAEAHNKITDERKQILKEQVVKATGNKFIVPFEYPSPFKEQWDNLQNEKDHRENYPFRKDNVEEFAEFCLQSGGFKIS